MAKPESSNSTGPEMVVPAIIALMGLLWVARFLPLILGTLFLTALVTPPPSPLLRRSFFDLGRTLTLVCLSTYLLLGLPYDFPGAFPGILGLSPDFEKWVLFLVRKANSLIPSPLAYFRIRSLSMLDLALYGWIATAAAAIMAVGFVLVTRKSRPSPPKSSPLLQRAIAAFSRSVFESVFLVWFRIGRGIHQTRQGRALFVLPFLFPLAALMAITLPYPDLKLTLLGLLCLPAANLLSGLVSRFSFFSPRQKTLELGFCLGLMANGRPYRLTETNLGYHVEIIAPSGSGKTNLLQLLIENRIRLGHAVIFVDLKAEFDLVNWVYDAACRAGRGSDFRLISLADEALSVPYNPVKYGSASEIHSQLMNSITWSEDFYRKVASMALQTLIAALCEYRDKTKENFHLGHVTQLLQSTNAMECFLSKATEAALTNVHALALLADQLQRPAERDKLMGLVAGLSSLIHSSAGNLLTKDAERGSFDLNEAVDSGRITYFSINSLKLRESAAVFGKLLLQDVMRFVGDRYSQTTDRQRKPVTLIIDEFASFALPDFINLMDRARGAGIGIVLAHQSRADLRAISPEFQERIEANSNTTIVSGVKSSEDADYYAGMIGTRTTIKETIQKVRTMALWFHETGVRASREAEEYILHPNRVKALQQGEVLVVTRTVKSDWGLVSVPKAKELAVRNSDETTLAARKVRASYLCGKAEKYLTLQSIKEPVTEEKSPPQASPWRSIVGGGTNVTTPDSNTNAAEAVDNGPLLRL